MALKNLFPADIHGSDPIAGLLRKWKVTPWAAFFFSMIAGGIYAYLLPQLWGYRFEVDGFLINIVLVYPVAAYFYISQPARIIRTYDSAARYLREEDQSQHLHFEKIAKTHARKIWWLIGLVFGLLGAYFGITYGIQHFGEFSYSANILEIFLVQFFRFIAFYAIGVSASRHIATSIELNILFENADFPLTVDADRLEVFRSVKNFALEFVGVAAIIALNLGLQPLLTDPPIVEYSIYVALYFIVAPVSFFLPVWEAHLRMSKIKNGMLDRLNYDFQEESQRLYRKFDMDTTSISYQKQAETLVQLEKTIETVARATDWPFQGTTFYRLAATVVSPFLLVLFEIFINVISNLITIK